MAAFQRALQRFLFAGISVNGAPDLMRPGKFLEALNVRCYQEGVLTSRPGKVAQNAALADTNIHSIFQLNDPTPLAAPAALQLIGAGTNVYAGPVGGPFPAVDAGWSGDPLMAMAAQPPQAAQPWLYLSDRSRMRKFNTNGVIHNVGIAAPTEAPSVVVAQIGLNTISDMEAVGPWGPAGTAAGAVSVIARVNTTIATILYDSGATGYASISAASMAGITVGSLLILNAAETVLVTDLTMAVASTTIGAILYDTGTTGLCTIQPTASLGVGQLEAPPVSAYRVRDGFAVPRGQAGGLPLEPPQGFDGLPAPNRRIRQVDFPVNALVTLGGAAETVRILSVAIGQDGVQSFRCSTTNTHGAGDTIAGLAAFRAHLTTTRAGGDTVTTNALENTITGTVPTGSDSAPVTGGIRATLSTNLALINGRATLPDDDLHLCVRIDKMTEVQTVRVYFDVDAATPSADDFLRNYYFFEWRASDIIAAIQSTNAAVVSPIATARQTVVTNTALDQTTTTDTPPETAVPRIPGTTPAPPPTRTPTGSHEQHAAGRRATNAERAAVLSGRGADAANATSAQMAMGNNQWVDLRCKVRDLIHIGTESSRTLANVAAVEILVSAVVPTATPSIVVDYDALWLAGGYGPDSGDIGNPYVFCYRYRSTSTGVISNPSPASRGGVIPRRQRVDLTGTQSSDAQTSKVDWFVFGGALTQWTYMGSGDNGATPTFSDTYADSAISGGATLEFDNFKPWPTTDLPRTMTVTVAGTSVQRTGGTDTFNTSWAPGTVILINGVVCTLYASPSSTTRLVLNENAGSGTGLTAYVPNATLLGQPLPAMWGSVEGYHFGCGDPTNPAVIYYSKRNNPDQASDASTLIVPVGQATEPLQNGFVWDGVSFVFSTDNLYVLEPITPTALQPSPFRPQVTPCGRGLWTRWVFATAPEGIYFLAKDGIYLTTGGSPAKSITDEDLRSLFPHDGVAGTATVVPGAGYSINPPDLTQTAALKLTYVDGLLYFDHLTSAAEKVTLVYDTARKAWSRDRMATGGIKSRLWVPGLNKHAQYMGGDTGIVYLEGGLSDAGAAIACEVVTPWVDLGDARGTKLWGDYIVDADPQASTTLTAILSSDDATATTAPVVIGSGLTGRQPFTVDLASGAGLIARNVGLILSWTESALAPKVFLWEPSYVPKVEIATERFQDWDDLGFDGAKQIRGIRIWGDTLNVAKPLQLQYDGGTVAATITPTLNGEKVFSIAFAPFIANLVRLSPTTTVTWRLYHVSFIFDPKPDLTAQYTDWDNNGSIGIKQVRELILHVDTGGGTPQVQVQKDDGAIAATITLAASTGEDGQPFSFNPPFYSHVMRLVPLGNVRIIGRQWIADPKPELVAGYTDWTDAGYQGTKQIRGIVLHVDTGGGTPQVQVQKDDGAVAQTLTLAASTGEDGQGFSFNPPVYARILRLVPLGVVRFIQPPHWIFDEKPELTAQYTDWTTGGYLGTKQVRGIVLHVDTGGGTPQVQIQKDNGVVAQTLTLAASTGEEGQPFAFVPFYATVMRLVPLGPVRIIQAPNWIADAKPELTTQYTDWTDAGTPGDKLMLGMVLHVDTGGVPVVVDVQTDNSVLAYTVTIPATTGEDGAPFAFDPPFYAHVLRLVPHSAWRLIGPPLWNAVPKPELTDGYSDWQAPNGEFSSYFQGVVLHVDTNGVAGVQVQVQSDDNVVQQTFTLAASTGEDGQPFSFDVPFVAHVVRIVKLGVARLLTWRWVAEPTPEPALTWQTQPTTHDAKGYLFVRDAVLAFVSSTPWTLEVAYDGGVPEVYTMPSSGGVYARQYVPFVAAKGRSVTYKASSSAPLQLFARDCSVRVGGWGSGDGYIVAQPFGGPHRATGAAI